jgi:hypothetical protein
VEGWSQEDAEAELGGLGFSVDDGTITIEYDLSDDHEPGHVMGIAPTAGTSIEGVDKITLAVVGIEIPDVLEELDGPDTTVADAIALLADLDLDWTLKDGDGEDLDEEEDDGWTVDSQEPVPGVYRQGTVVTLFVAL